MKASNDDWAQKLADELRKPIRRNFVRRRFIVSDIDDVWSADLIDMQGFSN